MRTALTRRSKAASFGNSVATLVRRLISLLRRSSKFEVRILRRCAGGKTKTVSPSGTLAANQAASFGAVLSYLRTARSSRRSASARSGASKIARRSAATSARMVMRGT